MVQKRCYRGEFRLRPDPVVRQILQYCLAYSANKCGIDLHEFVVMFNHDHIQATDPLGKRPKFLGEFHSLVARAVNTYFGVPGQPTTPGPSLPTARPLADATTTTVFGRVGEDHRPLSAKRPDAARVL